MNTFKVECLKEPIVLVFCGDDNSAILLAVALHSALLHLRQGCSLQLYIMDGGISRINKEKILRLLERDHVDINVEWIVPDMMRLSDLGTYGHLNATSYLRLLVPDLVAEHFEKAIYLDCDVQVKADLSMLWQEKLDEHALLAVRDFVIPYVSSPAGVMNYEALGLRMETPYFNAGVIVMNLKRWRTEKLGEKIISTLRQSERYLHEIYEQYRFTINDQYGMNAVLATDWGVLDPKWNVMSTIFWGDREGPLAIDKYIRAIREDLVENAYIYHFTGYKPWKLACENPLKVSWRRSLEESGWFSRAERMRHIAAGEESHLGIGRASGMRDSKVTIGIPTYNRSHFLKSCLESVLAQDYDDFQVLVLDNASTDDSEAVVRSFADSRVTYIRNETNVGLFGNWNRVLEMTRSPYLTILPDDDVILPGFIRNSVMALSEHQNAAFSAALARYIDANGNRMHLQDAGEMPAGLVGGLDYLHHIVAGPVRVVHPATAMMRSSALARVGTFKAPHSKQLLDLNLYIRLAARFDIVLIPEELAHVRLHSKQAKELEFRAIEGTQALAMNAERTDAVAHLLESERAEDASYRGWLAGRLLCLNRYRGDLTRLLVPSLNFRWTDRMEIGAREIVSVIPWGETFILVDEKLWGSGKFAGRHALPFVERDGVYWGNPPDDETAIQEAERMRRSGATFIVFAWPAFWYFDYYLRFYGYLRATYRCLLENDRLVVFELRPVVSPTATKQRFEEAGRKVT